MIDRPELFTLNAARVTLRHATAQDIPAILSYFTRNEAYLAPFEPVKFPAFYTEAYWQALLTQRIADTRHDRSLKLFIFLKEPDNTLIGSLNFSNFTRGVFQNCTVGYSLDEAHQGQGYMHESLSVGIDYIFNQLKFHRLEANYLPHNHRSGNLLKRLGFTPHGYARNYLYIAGEWQDHVLTHLLNPDLTHCTPAPY
ncbi:MAG: GNAT family N-acetyltransferase [Phormidesmis sp.]